MFNRLQNFATGKNVLIFLGLELIFMMGVMPFMGKQMGKLTENAQPIDLEIPTYSAERAHEMVEGYGEEGRALYKKIEMTADVIYPLLYGFAFALVITFLMKKAASGQEWTKWLALLPLIAMSADFIENFFIINLLNQFPQQPNQIAEMAAIFSLIKWSFFFSTLGTIVVGLSLLLKRKIRR